MINVYEELLHDRQSQHHAIFTDIVPESRQTLDLVPVGNVGDILPRYRHSPIGELLAAHNLGRVLPIKATAELLIITCMDHRVTFDIPEFFAYQIRTAGATPQPVASNVAFAVAVAGVRAICVISHTDCTMAEVGKTRDRFTDSLVENEGWHPFDARDHRILLEQVFRIDDPVRAAWKHCQRLADQFRTCVVAPLLYRVDDGALLQIVGADERLKNRAASNGSRSIRDVQR